MAEDITRSHERVLFARFILDFDLAQKTVALVAVKNARSLNGEIERQLLRRFRWSSPLLFDDGRISPALVERRGQALAVCG
jgi:hypothetical protein